jgi:hypothetical protein
MLKITRRLMRETAVTDRGRPLIVELHPGFGIADLGPDGYERFSQETHQRGFGLRITPRYYNSHLAYLWTNRLCLGIGELDMQQLRISYDIYAVH